MAVVPSRFTTRILVYDDVAETYRGNVVNVVIGI